VETDREDENGRLAIAEVADAAAFELEAVVAGE